MSEERSWLKFIDELGKEDRPLHHRYCPLSQSEEYCKEEDCAWYAGCLNNIVQLVYNLNNLATMALASIFPTIKLPKEGMN